MYLSNDPELRSIFFRRIPLIDVRAPIEFESGSVPNSVNLPIMNNEERRLVGICYKEHGQERAIQLGHELVGGKVKQERIGQWKNYIKNHPDAEVFCFRGGLRSQISCQWLEEAGIKRIPIKGGYKRMRSFFLSQLEEAPLPPLYRLSGLTGSGKTRVLNQISNSIDLEHLASHRGSAFGGIGPQPSQVLFENELGLELMKKASPVVVEDESVMIGKLTLPRRFYLHMRNSPLIILNSTLEQRIENIFQEYVKDFDFGSLHSSLIKIERKLGGLRFKQIENEMNLSFQKEMKVENHQSWISQLLEYYYDPIYARDLAKQNEKILYQGTERDILEYLKSKLIN